LQPFHIELISANRISEKDYSESPRVLLSWSCSDSIPLRLAIWRSLRRSSRHWDHSSWVTVGTLRLVLLRPSASW